MVVPYFPEPIDASIIRSISLLGNKLMRYQLFMFCYK